jgi:hypothetical protein
VYLESSLNLPRWNCDSALLGLVVVDDCIFAKLMTLFGLSWLIIVYILDMLCKVCDLDKALELRTMSHKSSKIFSPF